MANAIVMPPVMSTEPHGGGKELNYFLSMFGFCVCVCGNKSILQRGLAHFENYRENVVVGSTPVSWVK